MSGLPCRAVPPPSPRADTPQDDGPQSAMVAQLLSRLEAARRTLSTGDSAAAFSEFAALAPAVPDARLALVSLLRHGIGCSPQPARAWRVLETMLGLDWPPAMLHAALWLRTTHHRDGMVDRSIEKDDERSLQLLEGVLELEPENSDALCALGVARLYGRGCRTDVPNGMKLLVKAADLGHSDAMCCVAKWMMDRSRKGRKADEHDGDLIADGYILLKHSASLGNAYAHYGLAELSLPGGVRISDGPGAEKDMKQRQDAHFHFHHAGDLGAPLGYLELGHMYSKGRSVEGEQFIKAAEYYGMAADCGVLHAYAALGSHIDKGDDGSDTSRIDAGTAVHWFEKGYAKRDAESTRCLAYAYDNAVGVAADPKLAEELYGKTIEFAQRDKNERCRRRAAADRDKLYAARCFLGCERAKYEALLGCHEAPKLTKEGPKYEYCRQQTNLKRIDKVEAILTKAAAAETRTRRAAIANVIEGARDVDGFNDTEIHRKLEMLVGKWSAKMIMKTRVTGAMDFSLEAAGRVDRKETAIRLLDFGTQDRRLYVYTARSLRMAQCLTSYVYNVDSDRGLRLQSQLRGDRALKSPKTFCSQVCVIKRSGLEMAECEKDVLAYLSRCLAVSDGWESMFSSPSDKIVDEKSRLAFLYDGRSTGVYFVILHDGGGGCEHVVVVDLDRRLIFDPTQAHALVAQGIDWLVKATFSTLPVKGILFMRRVILRERPRMNGPGKRKRKRQKTIGRNIEWPSTEQ